MTPRGDPPPCGRSDCGRAALETDRRDSRYELASTSLATSAILRRDPSARRRGGEEVYQVPNKTGESRMALASRDQKDEPWQSIDLLDGYTKNLHQKRPRAAV